LTECSLELEQRMSHRVSVPRARLVKDRSLGRLPVLRSKV
jgi:hypothetical protein